MRPCRAIAALLVLFAAAACGQQAGPKAAQNPPSRAANVLVIKDIGQGLEPMDGDWQFHLGDDLRWAQPSWDDSNWESAPIDDSGGWGAHGHPSYAGFAWYRRHIDLTPVNGKPGQYSVLIFRADDAYEVYWNGKLIGQYGKVPPHAWWYYAQFSRAFTFDGSTSGVLAIRAWKAPLDAFSLAEIGGLWHTPYIGDPLSISIGNDQQESEIIQGDLFDYGLVLVRVFIAFLCVVLWYRDRDEFLFIWVAVFTSTPVANNILQRLFRIPFHWNIARFLNQPIYVLYHVSLWFLLVWLLRLHENTRLVRWTKALAYVAMAAGILDGILGLFWAHATLWMQWSDGILDTIILLVEVFPFVAIFVGLRHKLDSSRWVVALSALLVQMINTVADVSALGQRFTHWTLFTRIIDTPLIKIQGVNFDSAKIMSLVLFAAILYAVYRYALEQAARHGVMERRNAERARDPASAGA